jgi:hypothetical protein
VRERADRQAEDMEPKPLLEVARADGSVQGRSQLFAGSVSLANFYRGGIEKSVGEGKSPKTEAWGSRKQLKGLWGFKILHLVLSPVAKLERAVLRDGGREDGH